MAVCDTCAKACCAVSVFVPAILFNLFVLLFPVTGVVMMLEGDYAAGLITLVVGAIFFLGSIAKTILPLIRVFCGVDVEEILYERCANRMTCCAGCCFRDMERGSHVQPQEPQEQLSSIRFADGSGRIFTISHPQTRSSRVTRDITNLPVPPEDKSKNSIEGECCICYDSHRKIAFIPCGHVVCEDCVRKLTKWECHVCRQKITSLLRLYYGCDSETTLKSGHAGECRSVSHKTTTEPTVSFVNEALTENEATGQGRESTVTFVNKACEESNRSDPDYGQSNRSEQDFTSEGRITIDMPVMSRVLSRVSLQSQRCMECSSTDSHRAVFYPCGHVSVCYACAVKLSKKRCPECQVRVRLVTEVYL